MYGKTKHIQMVCRRKSCRLSEEKFVDSLSAVISLRLYSEVSQSTHYTTAFDNDTSHNFIVGTGGAKSIMPVQVLEMLLLVFCKKRTAAMLP